MITETAEVETALAPLRAQGIPVNFQRLVIKGAEATAAEADAAAAHQFRIFESAARSLGGQGILQRYLAVGVRGDEAQATIRRHR